MDHLQEAEETLEIAETWAENVFGELGTPTVLLAIAHALIALVERVDRFTKPDWDTVSALMLDELIDYVEASTMLQMPADEKERIKAEILEAVQVRLATGGE